MLLVGLISACGVAPRVSTDPMPDNARTRGGEETTLLRFDDFVSRGLLTFPTDVDQPVPAVLLIHGSGPSDHDFSFGIGEDGKHISAIGKSIATYLAEHGFASLRYNKRHVYGARDCDLRRFVGLSIDDFTKDAEVALRTLQRDPRVRRDQLFIIGYDEGAVIATRLASQDELEIRGVIGIGAVIRTFAETHLAQYEQVGLPFLERFSRDGALDLLAVQEANFAEAGVIARHYARLLLDRNAPLDAPRLDRTVDLNRDGRIELDSELTPRIRAFFSEPDKLGPHATAAAMSVLVEDLSVPVLLLHGDHDGTVPAGHARSLADHSVGVTTRILAGLGHTLGTATSTTDDAQRPIELPALEAARTWLQSQLRDN